jgi:hypothetical protein
VGPPPRGAWTVTPRVYRGSWGEDGPIAFVQVGDRIAALGSDPRVAAAVDWGTHARGTGLLARAILEHLLDDPLDVETHAPHLTELLASLPRDGFALREEEILGWLDAQVAA